MKKALQLIAVVVVVLLVLATPAFAADTTPDLHGTYVLAGGGVGAGLGAALTIIGAGFGFGKIGAAALESMARQPEVAGKVLVPMIAIAALLEGATLFALVVCLQVVGVAKF